ncbi:LysR family transcriptional regulator [Bordetella sp. 15P40C-2]|uniref:LysR family transcriptional regulator n=1 Tax=Bordetella sp. 15P40C-2 TaxID=2572246 RepID=UPI00132B4706|nr:LysR family transcriptional regulator [Bordetella sp. 15P40C-2]MVW73019.1 LysR family transcriptional regulator [Bordetella sp. 15P40C-2]
MAANTDGTERPESHPTIRFDLVDLETFIAVADLENFTLAARRLCISQPSVTSRIQRLEAMLRVPLLIRTTRSVQLSPHGVRLREEAEKVLRGMRLLIRDFHAEALSLRNRVVVAATPGIAAVVLPPLIRAFADRHPNIQLEVLDRQYEDVLASVDAGEADLAITSIDSGETRYDFHQLAQESMVLVLPSTHELANTEHLSLDLLVSYPLMTLERYKPIRDQLMTEALKRELRLSSIRTVANLTTLLGMVDAGNGLAFLPESMAQINAKTRRSTLHVADISLTRNYGILRSRQTPLSSAAQSFAAFLQESYTEIVAKADEPNAL